MAYAFDPELTGQQLLIFNSVRMFIILILIAIIVTINRNSSVLTIIDIFLTVITVIVIVELAGHLLSRASLGLRNSHAVPQGI